MQQLIISVTQCPMISLASVTTASSVIFASKLRLAHALPASSDSSFSPLPSSSSSATSPLELMSIFFRSFAAVTEFPRSQLRKSGSLASSAFRDICANVESSCSATEHVLAYSCSRDCT